MLGSAGMFPVPMEMLGVARDVGPQPEVTAMTDTTQTPMDHAGPGEQRLMNGIAVAECQQRWGQIQHTFEQDPRAAVAQAHTLVTEIVEAYRCWAAHIAQGWCAAETPAEQQDLAPVLDGYHDVLRELIGL